MTSKNRSKKRRVVLDDGESSTDRSNEIKIDRSHGDRSQSQYKEKKSEPNKNEGESQWIENNTSNSESNSASITPTRAFDSTTTNESNESVTTNSETKKSSDKLNSSSPTENDQMNELLEEKEENQLLVKEMTQFLQSDRHEKNVLVKLYKYITSQTKTNGTTNDISNPITDSTTNSTTESTIDSTMDVEIIQSFLESLIQSNLINNHNSNSPQNNLDKNSIITLLHNQKQKIEELETKLKHWETDFDEECTRVESKYKHEKEELRKLLDLERSDSERYRIMVEKLEDELHDLKANFNEDKVKELETEAKISQRENDRLRESVNKLQKENALLSQNLKQVQMELETNQGKAQQLEIEKESFKRTYLHHALLLIKVQSQDPQFNTYSIPELVDEALRDNITNLVTWLRGRGFAL